MDELDIFIGGQWRRGGGNLMHSQFPADGAINAALHAASLDDLQEAIDCADRAWREPTWRAMLPHQRAKILHKVADLIEAQLDELTQKQSRDNGKPLAEARGLVMSAAGTARYFAAACELLEGELPTPRQADLLTLSRYEPLGVVAAITPWNSPIASEMQKVAPAIAAGNAVILKPAEATPLMALELAKIFEQAGLPAGLLSVLPGKGSIIGDALARHPKVRKISFTGGTTTGRHLAHVAAEKLIPASLELGGKSPLIIADDADLDLAADIAMMANFYSSGQVCTNGTRVFVPAKRKAEFEHKILERVARIRPGDLFADDTNFGPLVSFPHRDNVLRYIESGKREGARLLCGGEALKGDGFDNGAWVAPTVFTDCSDEMTIVREEIFGPVMSILSYADEAEVIRRANATEYGLAAGVVTPNLNRAHRIIHQLEAGICWINSWGESPAEMPVGGYKHSGIGRENGVMTLQSYTQVKSIQVEMGKFQSIF